MSSNKNIPQLRFPEFSGEWEGKKLKECVNRIKTGKLDANAMVDDGEYRFYTCAKEYSFIDSYAFEGDCILIAGNGAHLGYVHHYNGKFNAYQRTYVLSDFTCDSFFLEYCIKRYLPDRISEEIKDGNTPYIVLSTITDMVIPLPNSKKEQMKIAECLSDMDNLISAQGQKVEALKEKKRGMMQQMFPQKDETTPRLRFPGFTGEWGEKKFKEITYPSGKKNRHNLPYERYSISNEVGFYPQSSQFEDGGGYLKNIDCRQYIIVSPHSFAYNPARINVGSIGYQNLEKDVIVSSLYEVFQTNELCDDLFLWQWFHSDIFHRMVIDVQEGGVRQYFFYEKLRECIIRLPLPAEQQKIAECLSAMDDMIASESAKLDALKDHKKGLMQQLFPQPNK